ncbi:MAG: hypothetical protein H0Z28_05685 [Archaeoglobus sp.]|nr:hypothetical protein [Archaeoglobus sp.]
MKILRLLSDEEFEVEGDLRIGDVLKAANTLAIVISISHDESEIGRYLGIETEKLVDFLPDLSEGRRVARCFILHCNEHPKPGEEVEIADDDELRGIHLASGEFSVPYLVSMMKKCRERLWVVRDYLERLANAIPEEKDVIGILKAEVEYRMLKDMEV